MDERQGYPSASEIERLQSCPASFLRSKNQPDKSSEVAQSGTRIHSAIETGDTSQLNINEEKQAEKCLRLVEIVKFETDFAHADN